MTNTNSGLSSTSGNMLYWVIYDIGDNRLRSKIAVCCKNYGLVRVQKSAFLGFLTPNRADMLAIEVKEAIGKNKTDAVFIIPTCKQCYKDKKILGQLDEDLVQEQEYRLVD